LSTVKTFEWLWLAGADENQAAQLLNEADGCAWQGVGAAAHQQRAREQHRFAFPQRGQGFDLSVAGRHVLSLQDVQPETEPRRDLRSHIGLPQCIVTNQPHERRMACGRHFDGVVRVVGDCAMRLGHGSRRHRRTQQTAQTNVEIIRPGEVVKDALVDTQTPTRNAG
jgi:hypothetical protein